MRLTVVCHSLEAYVSVVLLVCSLAVCGVIVCDFDSSADVANGGKLRGGEVCCKGVNIDCELLSAECEDKICDDNGIDDPTCDSLNAYRYIQTNLTYKDVQCKEGNIGKTSSAVAALKQCGYFWSCFYDPLNPWCTFDFERLDYFCPSPQSWYNYESNDFQEFNPAGAQCGFPLADSRAERSMVVFLSVLSVLVVIIRPGG